MRLKQLTDWKVKGFWPYHPLRERGMELGNELRGVTEWIKAEVPGSIHMDLLNAGLIEDPYFEMNSLKCEWVSNRWWVYRTKFTIEKNADGKRVYLVFRGIDYKAHIYLNGVKLKEHTGMYTVCRLDITDLYKRDEENILQVAIESAPDEMGQIGYTNRTWTQKARFGYKWDFSTRLINLGLYDEVYLETCDTVKITEKKITYKDGKVNVSVRLDKTDDLLSKIEAKIMFDGDLIDAKSVSIGEGGWANLVLDVKEPKLWWPNGYGEQPLYDVEVFAYNHNGELSDETKSKFGLRSLRFEQCEDAQEGSLPYRIFINDEPIYIKGVNVTPLDHMYGIVDEKRYDETLKSIKECNINMVRVWGGGIIEKEDFYNLCDKYGLMVWQEFIQSSSGMSNEPSKLPQFLELCAKTVECATKEKRNHVSLTIWGGGNELMLEGDIPVTYEDENIAMIKRIVEQHDTEHLFLPTSASGPQAWNTPENEMGNHDIHGSWKYMGPVEHYTCYNTIRCQLHSEFGNDGMSNMESLKKVLSPENLKVDTMSKNLVWSHHGDWWDTYDYRDKEIFGEIKELEDFVVISQYMQAEGLRYSLESHRRRAFINAGALIWQFNEPWVNVSCTSIVDYYVNPKFAYYFVRDAFKPFHVSLKHNKLLYSRGEVFNGSAYVHDELLKDNCSGTVRILNDNRELIKEYSFSCETKKGYAVKALEFDLELSGIDEVFYAECTIKSGERTDKNEYMFFIKDDSVPFANQKAVLDYTERYMKAEMEK